MPRLIGVAVATAVLSMLVATVPARAADEKPSDAQKVTVRVTGLFQPDRVDDLRELLGTLDGLAVDGINFETSEATFTFVPATLFPNARPEQLVERLDNLLRTNSRSTFGARPVCTIPRDRLELVEIGVVGLDCKGCSLGAYEAIFRIEGVEQATASFKEGLVTAWIDPEKTNRAALEAALTQRRVELKTADAP